MTRRVPGLVVALFLALAALVPMGAAAADSAPIPSSMAAVGDSITQAASSAGSLGTGAPQNSWSTGTSTTVNSHLLRLRALNPQVVAYNRSVSGAKIADLVGQMDTVVTLSPDPGYLTVLIGGNDLCTDTVAQMTSVDDFRGQFASAMQTITTGSPGTYVYVASIPDVYQLWNLFKNNFWARFVWNSAKICQSLLANPTSTQSADVQRRAAVRQRNIDYNTQLAQVCAAHASRCRFDGNAVFRTAFTSGDVAGDYFHPSVAGQAKLASVTWSAGYSFTSGATPTPTPTASPTPTPIPTPTPTPPTATPTPTIAPSDPPPAARIRVADLEGVGSSVNRNFWSASVTATITGTDGALIGGATVTGRFGDGPTKSCTTASNGTCTVLSDNLRTNVASVTFTLGDVSHATLIYDAGQNVETSVPVTRP